MMLIMRMKMMRWLEVSGGDLMCDHSWGRTSNKARATCIILTFPLLSLNIEIGKTSVSYSPLHDHQEHHVNDDHQPSNKARAISSILSPQVFFTIIIEYRTRPYQPTCSNKDIRFHSDPQSSMA